HNSRNCWRTASSLRCSHVARNALTAVNAQERASTIPRLPRAKTVACGLLKWGRRVWMMVVHAVTRGWQDIGILLGVMGATQPPIRCPTEGCLVISMMMSYRHFSQTYPRKELRTPPTAHARAYHRARWPWRGGLAAPVATVGLGEGRPWGAPRGRTAVGEKGPFIRLRKTA